MVVNGCRLKSLLYFSTASKTNGFWLTHFVQLPLSTPQPAILDIFLSVQFSCCGSFFLEWKSGGIFQNQDDSLDQLDISYVPHLGMDPDLQDTLFRTRVLCLSSLFAQMQSGYHRRGKQVNSNTVASTLSAVSTSISLDQDANPTKVSGWKACDHD